jgi:F-type H+-transporting ATPase subunit alpha
MAQIRADEISRILKSEIQNFDAVTNVAETGSVISVGDGIARVFGLKNVMAGELVEFGPDTFGIYRRPDLSRNRPVQREHPSCH